MKYNVHELRLALLYKCMCLHRNFFPYVHNNSLYCGRKQLSLNFSGLIPLGMGEEKHRSEMGEEKHRSEMGEEKHRSEMGEENTGVKWLLD